MTYAPPPPDPRYHGPVEEPSWRGVLASYAVVAAIPLALLVASDPLAGALVLAAIGDLVVAARRGARLVRCFRDCGGFSFALGGRVRVTVSQPSVDEAC